MSVALSLQDSNFQGARSNRLSGNRLHLNEGPIDLVIGAEGPGEAVAEAYRRAEACFHGLLHELVSELSILRRPIGTSSPKPSGRVARRMVQAVAPYVEMFITPMASVAGSVADEILAAMTIEKGLTNAYVNNGGDIAIHIEPGNALTVGLVPILRGGGIGGSITINSNMRVRGIATSGMEGRSFSLGIADAVTVLSPTAAVADAAATVIANLVNVDHAAISRTPASSLDPDSDLGELPVVIERGPLPDILVSEALDVAQQYAQKLIKTGLIDDAYIACAGQIRGARCKGLQITDKI